MDSMGKKRVGRPKTVPQSGPLVLGANRVRVKVEVDIPESTASELGEYARWVELSSRLSTEDALATTVEFALQQTFQRDRLWQQKRRERPAAEAPAVATTPKAPPSPAALPLPAPSTRPMSIPSTANGR